jgi:hypothetical protein
MWLDAVAITWLGPAGPFVKLSNANNSSSNGKLSVSRCNRASQLESNVVWRWEQLNGTANS